MTNDEIRAFIEQAIQRERGDALHEGHARPARAAASRCARPRRSTRSACKLRRARHPPRPAHPPGAVGDLRAGRRSRSCSSNGELVGGCDIVTEMYESGELAELLGVEQPDEEPEAPVHGGAGDQQPRLVSPPLGLENRLEPRARSQVLHDPLRIVDDLLAVHQHGHPALLASGPRPRGGSRLR